MTHKFCMNISVCYKSAVAKLVEVLYYKSEVRGFESRWIIEIFNVLNLSSRTMALGLTQPLTRMSTRNRKKIWREGSGQLWLKTSPPSMNRLSENVDLQHLTISQLYRSRWPITWTVLLCFLYFSRSK
jgi:hypothetical protein